ncbi:hypothetical protein EMCG_06942 [[Emmonsia] crescens]|uniref:NACHT domain-containing protein n=1 Tax=[Emmonsia] crescens TaxID=73230 RepID=A0A0G2J694_9EURO|nr:hypothetical protein EMCG_06942 [Emmonsia crescens UAMH 3008]
MEWTVDDVKESLLFVTAQSDVHVNIALFIDALDERTGDHRELLSLLHNLSKHARSANFRLRLCLASRPENIFQDAFTHAPGFAIPDMTKENIRQYRGTL